MRTDLKTVHAASVTAKNGKLLLRKVQYHVAKIVASTIWPKADTKNSNQKKPKTFIAAKKLSTSSCLFVFFYFTV